MGRRKEGVSVFRDIVRQQYDDSTRFRLYKSVKGSQDWVQRLGFLKSLPIHAGCVNCICWNDKGDKLLSGSDDQHLIVTNPYNYEIVSNYKSSHRANIFSAKFLPFTCDTGIVSCSGDGMILYSDLSRIEETHNNIFNCHIGTTYEIATIPDDPNSFLSCGEDCTVRCFDLRTKEKCNKTRCTDDVIISCQRAVTAVVVNSINPYQLAIGCSDSSVRIYDRRMLAMYSGYSATPFVSYIAPGMEGRSYRITSLSFSPNGSDILVSYSSEHLYLFGINNSKVTTLSPEESLEDMSETCPENGSSDTNSSRVVTVRRLRLRGDWSDTGPDARPQNECLTGGAQARPTLHGTLMQRMTDVLSRMLNDPATRAALSHGGEDSLPETVDHHSSSQSEPSQGENPENVPSAPPVEDVQPSLPSELSRNQDNPCSSNSLDVDSINGPSTSAQKENDPLDLPLPSFSSTYSSFVKPPTEEPPSLETPLHEEPLEQTDETKMQEDSPHPSTSTGAPSSDLNELSSMCHGFVEKHGKEPMLNLTYSDVGSTASCISVFVRDEVPGNSASDSSSQDTLLQDTSQNNDSHECHCPHEPVASPEAMETRSSEVDDITEDDSDDDLTPVMRTECRLVHPIEKHMDEAIKNARGEMGSNDDSVKTRRSFFKQKYIGHRNARTMIKEATFWGDNYVISGSDCGHVFMWEKDTAKLKMLLEADQHVVNCVQPHPYLPMLATSGIDYDVKLWAPVKEAPSFDSNMAEELMKRNAIMLEETKDTITVPASFMIRMLACLNQLRRGGRARHQRHEPTANSD
ncbi:DDB1- and CUL4-associated factor 6-like isoform X2 [Cimex lectularius]|uniref:DDB1- and CUL4-associated factor 6 n=1 Tax=Cimex lectularius TaxID=79782 RepID=A0A8I6REN8_CIMLE|nr:DDB1- and CUL4-associated factor 6-like isoform X2 [Cimex lectularius]